MSQMHPFFRVNLKKGRGCPLKGNALFKNLKPEQAVRYQVKASPTFSQIKSSHSHQSNKCRWIQMLPPQFRTFGTDPSPKAAEKRYMQLVSTLLKPELCIYAEEPGLRHLVKHRGQSLGVFLGQRSITEISATQQIGCHNLKQLSH